MKNQLVKALEQELKLRLLSEAYKYELEAFKSGSSSAEFEHEIIEVVLDFNKNTADQILAYYGYNFELFEDGDIIERMYLLLQMYQVEAV